MKLLTVKEIYKRGEKGFIINNISFSQQQFQKIAIAGETGSGKSTLLKIIAGIITPDSGEVWFNNERVKKVPEEKLIPGHEGIAYLSQHFELRNNYRIEELLAYANTLTDNDANNLFAICRINHLLKRRTDQLSGGEKQRIALARLLISSPKLLLLDEPFSNLDMIHKKILKSVITDVCEKLKITCTLVSHDPSDTLSWADEIFILKDGEIIQQGNPIQIYLQPVNEYAAALFGKYNLINAGNNFISKIPGIINDSKKIFIRPEYFKIVNKETNSIKGKIQEIIFFGNYYEINVLLENKISIIVHATNCHVKKNETVYIKLSAENIWHL
jgi:ABC-type sugar transport system ATPase subunit